LKLFEIRLLRRIFGPKKEEVTGGWRKLLESFRREWKDNIRMDLREIGLEGLDLIHLAEDRDQWRALVNTVMNLWVPLNARDFLIG
jgi:hypothetical protein